MAGPAEILRELHRLRCHARQLHEEIDRLPRLLKGQQANVTRREEVLKQTQDKITKLKVAAREKEKTLKASHEQIGKWEKQLNEAAGKKEYDALQIEIAHGRENCRKLEDEILGVMEETDQATGRIPELQAALDQARHDLANFDQIRQERHAVLSGELQKTLAELVRIEESLPERDSLDRPVRSEYLRLVKLRGEDALAAVSDRSCKSCYTSITADDCNRLRQGLFVICKSCGRMLYLQEHA
jgi:hypothetical protein